MSANSKNSLLTFGFLALFVSIFFPINTVNVPPDGVTYFMRTFEIANHFRYTHFFRGPGMPAITALAPWLSGGSITSVFVVPRIMFVLAVFILSGFVWRLYGNIPALFAGVYFIFSPITHKVATQFQLDVFVVVWGLASIWALYEALTRRSIVWAIVSGIFLAFTFLTKEVALVLFPLWLISWLLFQPYKSSLKLSGIALLAAMITIIPWGILIVVYQGDLSMLLGVSSSVSDGGVSGMAKSYIHGLFFQTWDTIMQVLMNIINAYRYYFLSGVFSKEHATQFCMDIYGVLFLVSQIVLVARVVFRKIRKNRSDMFVLLAFCVTLPLFVLLGRVTLDPRQAAIVFSIGALAMGAFARTVMDMMGWLYYKVKGAGAPPGPNSQSVSLLPVAVSAIFLFSLLLVFGAVSPNVRAQFTGPTRAFAFFCNERGMFQPIGHMGLAGLKAGQWIRERLGPGEKVLAVYPRDRKMLLPIFSDIVVRSDTVVTDTVVKHNVRVWLDAFKKGGEAAASQTIIMLGRDGPYQPVAKSPHVDGQQKNLIMLRANRDMALLHCCEDESAGDLNGYFQICKLYFVEEQGRLENIVQNNVKYIIVSYAQGFQARYFEKNPAFKKVKTIKDNNPASGAPLDVNIFEVVAHHPIEGLYLPTVSPSIADFLDLFEDKDPEAYRVWERQVLKETMGASEDQIKAIRKRRALNDAPCIDCPSDEN